LAAMFSSFLKVVIRLLLKNKHRSLQLDSLTLLIVQAR
jgi:hypothetical protein